MAINPSIEAKDPLATFVIADFDVASTNRRPITQKWEKNREAVLGITTGQWKPNHPPLPEGMAEWRSSAIANKTRQ